MSSALSQDSVLGLYFQWVASLDMIYHSEFQILFVCQHSPNYRQDVLEEQQWGGKAGKLALILIMKELSLFGSV